MEFLDIFSLTDVFIAATGLMVASILRIYYDSYVEKKKISNFGNSLALYNSTIEHTKDGLLIISDTDEIIFLNTEAEKILNPNKNRLDSNYLNSILIENHDTDTHESFMEILHTKRHIANAYIVTDSHKLAISVTINKVNVFSHKNNHWYVIILQDMTVMNELREKSKALLSV